MNYFSEYSIDRVLQVLSKIRKDKGFSQEYMAKELGMSKISYYRCEKGDVKLTIELFFSICKLLSVNPVDVFIPVEYGGFYFDPVFFGVIKDQLDKNYSEKNRLIEQVAEYNELIQMLRKLEILLTERFYSDSDLIGDTKNDALFISEEEEKAKFFERLDNDFRFKKLFELGIFNSGFKYEYWLEYCDLKKRKQI